MQGKGSNVFSIPKRQDQACIHCDIVIMLWIVELADNYDHLLFA
jgi:hypothetical protein